MSMSTHVVGFRKADEQWNKMKAAWLACEAAGASIPDAVYEFFGGEYPGDKPGCEVEIEDAVSEWDDEDCHGYEVDLTKLPKGVKIIRFYNSW